MHQPLSFTPAPERASTPELLGGSAPPKSRAALAASAALHIAILAAVWRLAAHVPEPPPVAASFDIVFPATPTSKAAVPLPVLISPAAVPTRPSTPAPASLAPPAPRPEVPRQMPPTHSPAVQATLHQPHAPAARHVFVPVSAATPAAPAPHAVAASSPVVEAPRPAPVPDSGVVAALEEKIDQAVNAAKSYPPTARRLGMQGRSQVSFSYRDGVVTNVAVTRSSSADMLDRAALDAVKRAAYPAAPSTLAHHPLQLAVWLDFSLRRADW